jgi:hypothetical protein
MTASHPAEPIPAGSANGRYGAGRAVPNAKLSDEEGVESGGSGRVPPLPQLWDGVPHVLASDRHAHKLMQTMIINF